VLKLVRVLARVVRPYRRRSSVAETDAPLRRNALF
jgi:hypothetical protein